MGKRKGASERLVRLDDSLHELIPHLYGVLCEEDDFIEFRVKAQDDGTVLGILKRYNPEGAPMVLFGGGYGVLGAFLTVDAAVQGNRWRVDKPWKPGK